MSGAQASIPVSNTTRWRELRTYILSLPQSERPAFRTRCLSNGHISDWDAEWVYHFVQDDFADIEWVELKDAIGLGEASLSAICDVGFVGRLERGDLRLFGYVQQGSATKRLELADLVD